MAINFPSNPSNGDTVAVGGINYVYDSTQGVWSDSPQGLAQSIDNLTDVDTSTTTPANRQVLQWSSTDNEWGPADSGVQVYATIDDLPLSGVTEGSMALVDSTDKLYIFSDTGWYSIAIVNQTPSITGVSATYTLAIDGSATTVTVTATDPEGLPITYSIVSDTSGNIATVSQGTGANTNQWTITPSTSTANAGNFTLVFRASDGTNVASASSTFTLEFAAENSKYTTALVTSVGANLADNNNFVDASSSSTTLTAYQDAHMTSFSPYRHGGYSTYFDGSGDNLTTASAILSTSGAFTVQCWVYLDDTSNAAIWAQGTSGNSQRASLSIESGNWYAQIGSAVINTTSAVANAWKFLEFQYSGSQIELFVDGTSVGTASNTTNAQNTGLFIGKLWATGYDLQGYVTDLRVINGTPTGSSTVPTERLTAITNTNLLACHLPYLRDGSTNGHSLGVSGDVATRPFSPYDVVEYNATDNGGSVRITSTGDYVGFQNGTDFEFDGDFTVACWVYFNSETGHNSIFSISDTGNDGFCQMGSDRLLIRNTTGTNIIDNSSYQIPANRWTHVALTRSGSDIKFFLNGAVTVTATSSATISEVSSVEGTIGRRVSSAGIGYFFGNIADLYVKNGTADYTAAFTPPLTPASSTGTVLHVKGTDAGIIDKSQSAQGLILNGDAKSSTAQTKYLSSSMAFDGTGDYIEMLAGSGITQFRTGDYTVEAWLYPNNTTWTLPWDFRSGTDLNALCLFWSNTTGKYSVFLNNAQQITASSTSSASQWHHVAVTRASGTVTLWVDGTSEGTATVTRDHSSDNLVWIGRYYASNSYAYNGYISDFRITKGLARYTSNFTAPTAALSG